MVAEMWEGDRLDWLGDCLRRFVPEVCRVTGTPGVSVALSAGDRLWAEGFGYADVRERVPVSEHTRFRAGSWGKALISLGIMRLVESGVVLLSDPVNQWVLDVPVVNPHGGVVTVESLLTHMSGLGTDTYGVTDKKPRDRRTYLREVFSRGKRHEYGGGELWAHAVGAAYAYSSLAFELLAYVIECVTGLRFEDFAAQHLMRPVANVDTTWRSPFEARADIATGYRLYPHRGIPATVLQTELTAACGVVTTPLDQVRVLRALLNGVQGRDGRILAPETVADMVRVRARGEHPGADRKREFMAVGLGFLVDEEEGAFKHGGAFPRGFWGNAVAYRRADLAVAVQGNGWESVFHTRPERAAAWLVTNYVGRWAAGYVEPKRPPTPGPDWDESYAMGVRDAEQERGLLNVGEAIPDEEIERQAAESHAVGSGDAWNAAGYVAGFKAVNGLPVHSPEAIRDFLRHHSAVTPPYLDLYAMHWGASDPRFPSPGPNYFVKLAMEAA